MSSKIAILATDAGCDLRNTQGMGEDEYPIDSFKDWLASAFKLTKKRKADLARELEIEPSMVSKMLTGIRQPKAAEMRKIIDFFHPEIVDRVEKDVPPINEIDVRGGSGGGGVSVEAFEPDSQGGHMVVDGVRERWGIPPSYLRQELRANPVAIRIIEVLGDSMDPTLKSGDRLLIDTLHRMPSPPGVYAVWDGIGVVVKRVELVPKTDPMRVKLISDNKSHGEYEVTAEEAQILGRVIAKVSTM